VFKCSWTPFPISSPAKAFGPVGVKTFLESSLGVNILDSKRHIGSIGLVVNIFLGYDFLKFLEESYIFAILAWFI
jgi:hypothetical protein